MASAYSEQSDCWTRGLQSGKIQSLLQRIIWSRSFPTLRLGFILSGSMGRLKVLHLPFQAHSMTFTLLSALGGWPTWIAAQGSLDVCSLVGFSQWLRQQEVRGRKKREVEYLVSPLPLCKVMPGRLCCCTENPSSLQALSLHGCFCVCVPGTTPPAPVPPAPHCYQAWGTACSCGFSTLPASF